MADGSEAFDFEALDEENELSSGITSQTDGADQAGTGRLIEKARFVTILSDFGEAEKFVIDGDSLLLWAFDELRLDWKHGGQFLHLVFICEKLISDLLVRGAHFAVVFFEHHHKIWGNRSLLFARSLIIVHLKRHLSSPASVWVFECPDSNEWSTFLSSFHPAFIALNDGAGQPSIGGTDPSLLAALASDSYARGINVVFLESLEIEAHAVSGFYIPSRSSGLNRRDAKRADVKVEQKIDISVVESFCQEASVVRLMMLTGNNWRSTSCAWALSTWLAKLVTDQDCTASAKAQKAVGVAKVFVVHITLLRRKKLTLSERCLALSISQDILNLANECQDHVFGQLATSAWSPRHFTTSQDKFVVQPDDIVDYADGRLFCSLLQIAMTSKSCDAGLFGLDTSSCEEAEALWMCACSNSGGLLPIAFGSAAESPTAVDNVAPDPTAALGGTSVNATERPPCIGKCQFLLEVLGFDEHETSVAGDVSSSSLGNCFLHDEVKWKISEPLETFLWTHCKDQSAGSESSSRSTSEWERKRQLRWKARQSQMYFRHLHDYAASLAGTTVLGSTCISSSVEGSDGVQNDEDVVSVTSEQSSDSKRSGKPKVEKKKPEKKLSKKEQMLADIEAKKQKGTAQKLEQEWKDLKVALNKSSSSVAKIKDLDDFITRCVSANQMTLALEVTLAKLSESKLAWQEDRDSKSTNMKFAILTVETIRSILVAHAEVLRDPTLAVAAEARSDLLQTMFQLGFIEPTQMLAKSFLDQSHKEQYAALQEETKEMSRMYRNKLSVSSKSIAHFQLEHMGYLLPRPPPKVKDPRITTFTPDDWQRALLDVVDARDSALVCAPTSSGKTFISYYCMEKVMRDTEHKDGILVFVAPTKALINQIAAQVYGAYHSQFGIYTDAYRHRALTCRILVTVPDCLESLLLAPEHSVWAQRIRFIILDEVHCISTSDGGRLWEHILLLSNAPFLALSATVGEPEAFVSWLQSLKDFQRQGDNGEGDETYNVRLVQHSERWVDLRRHVYVGPGSTGPVDASNVLKSARLHLRARVDHTSAEIDMAEVLDTLHPFASFTATQLEIGKVPVNLRFEPRDSLALFNAMWKVHQAAHADHGIKQRAEALTQLDPVNYFSGDQIFITKPQSVLYERDIKVEFEKWISNGWNTECVKVLKILGNNIVDDSKKVPDEDIDEAGRTTRSLNDPIERLFHLMCALHRQDRLPAVVFNFDRVFCESIAFGISAILNKAEEAARSEHAKTLAKSAKVESQKEKVQKRIRDKVVSEKKEEAMLQEMAEMADSSTVETVGLDEVTFKAQFTFVQEGRGSAQDFERITESARKIMGEGHPLIQILRRGIGVHHSGLQNKYRMAVEMLFRCGYLRIVVATETLAFGINMPCRSVVFAGDHVALNSIQYQQMSGRAGRRGLDVLGHVIFFDVPQHKMHRLMVAPVPKLHGHFLHSQTFLLRLLALYSLTPRQRGASTAVVTRVRNAVTRAMRKSLFDFVSLNESSVRALQGRHLIDGLVRDGLVDPDGTPSGVMTFAAHFHSLEPANLALVALLQAGALHKICEQPEGQGWTFTSSGPVWRGALAEWEAVERELLLVLSHLFSRQRLHSSLVSAAASSPRRGVVVLPRLPACCQDALDRHHQSSLAALTSAAAAAAVAVPVPQHQGLPLSGIQFDLRRNDDQGSAMPSLTRLSASVCNGFVGLSGGGDSFGTAHDLVASARQELGLHPALLPLPLSRGPPLSAYVLDFFAHEQLDVVCSECGMCSAVAWQGLRQFQLILSSLHKALCKYAPPTDVLLASVARLDAEYSAKFYAKLYR